MASRYRVVVSMRSCGPLVRFLGTGTPLGLRGLHQSCILVETRGHRVLVDCGMTALTSLGRIGIDPAEIDAVVISHLHGDHFGGLPLLLLEATLRARSRPLTIARPAATRRRVEQALELFGWTSARIDAATFVPLVPGVAADRWLRGDGVRRRPRPGDSADRPAPRR